MHRLVVLFVLVLATVLGASPAHATDTWTTPFAPFDGIARLHRSIPGQEIHAVFVDLTRSELHVRATRPGESGRTTTSFSNLVGAAVAINGDWFDSGGPVGLAVGDGELWPGTTDSNWSFIACTVENTCEIDTSGTDRTPHWRWRDLVGGNGAILAIGGQPIHHAGAFYDSDRHPRSAVGVSQDGQHLVFVVVEGRRAGANGMTFNEVADLLVEFGAWDGMMLDGGGSSSLVVGGTRVNRLPSGASERSVGNHLAIIRETSTDGDCQVANGRWCNGTQISTCQGNRNLETGDCAAFGAGCAVTDGIGHCVHPFCPASGNGTTCLDATRIGTCELGQLSEGDCAAFGASCEQDAQGAYCVHYLCSEGGNAAWCDGGLRKTCTRGEYAESPCGGDTSCVDGACVSPDPPPVEDMAMDDPTPDAGGEDIGTATDAGATGAPSDATMTDASAADTRPPGTLPDATSLGTVPAADAGADAGMGNLAEPQPGNDVDGACGCRVSPASDPPVGPLVLVALLVAGCCVRRRQRSDRATT